jgi:hypothetical protein
MSSMSFRRCASRSATRFRSAASSPALTLSCASIASIVRFVAASAAACAINRERRDATGV